MIQKIVFTVSCRPSRDASVNKKLSTLRPSLEFVALPVKSLQLFTTLRHTVKHNRLSRSTTMDRQRLDYCVPRSQCPTGWQYSVSTDFLLEGRSASRHIGQTTTIIRCWHGPHARMTPGTTTPHTTTAFLIRR